MVNDLTDYQAEAIAHGYTHDFGYDGRSDLPPSLGPSAS